MKKHHIADQCRTTQADVSLSKNENSRYGLKLESEQKWGNKFLFGIVIFLFWLKEREEKFFFI